MRRSIHADARVRCRASLVRAARRRRSAQQTLNFSLGVLPPRGEDARVDGDVLVANRDVPGVRHQRLQRRLGRRRVAGPARQVTSKAGAGVGFSRRTVPSVYADFVDTDGTEIEQDLRLRRVPIAFTVRVLPLGQAIAVQPYFGAGLGVFNWRYSEIGEFVDFGAGNAIFREHVRGAAAPRPARSCSAASASPATVSAGGEVRYQQAPRPTSTTRLRRRPKIDLGGWTYSSRSGSVRVGNRSFSAISAGCVALHSASWSVRLYSATPPPSQIRVIPRAKSSDRGATRCASTSPPSACSSISIQPACGAGPVSSARSQMRAVAFVNEVGDREAVAATAPACSARASPCWPGPSRRR